MAETESADNGTYCVLTTSIYVTVTISSNPSCVGDEYDIRKLSLVECFGTSN